MIKVSNFKIKLRIKMCNPFKLEIKNLKKLIPLTNLELNNRGRQRTLPLGSNLPKVKSILCRLERRMWPAQAITLRLSNKDLLKNNTMRILPRKTSWLRTPIKFPSNKIPMWRNHTTSHLSPSKIRDMGPLSSTPPSQKCSKGQWRPILL